MKIYFLSFIAFLLFQLPATAQSKPSPESCEPFGWAWRKLGGHLNMMYNGEYLRIALTAQVPDTDSIARKFIKEKSDGSWFSLNMGKMRIGDREVLISSTSSYISYEIHDHIVQFRVYAEDIPYTVSEDQTFDILMINFCPDTAEFVCTGSESIKKVMPTPGSYTSKQAMWVATVSNRNKRHCEFLVALSGTDKGAFGFSLLSLQKLNSFLEPYWHSVVWDLLTATCFWLFWFILLSGRNYFEKIDALMVRQVIKWLPWMAGFYFMFVLNEFTAACDAGSTLTWRIGYTTAAVCMLTFIAFWRKRATTPGTLLVKTLCRTLAYSLLVFVFLGAAIQVADHFLGKKNPFSGLGGFLQLDVSARYAIWAIAVCTLFIVFVLFKLFAFNRRLQLILISLVLIITTWEPYRILAAGVEEKYDCGISFTYPIKKIGETDAGSLHLTMSFSNLANLLFYIPFILVGYLIVQLARRKDQQRLLILMVPFFVIFYCCYLTNVRETFLLLPVTLLVTLWISRYVIERDTRTRVQLLNTGNQLYAQELNNMTVFRKMPELRQSVKLKDIYRQRLLKGELLPADYNKAVSDLDKLIGGSDAENVRRRMEFGPHQEYIRNGLSGLAYGALVSGIIYLVYFKLYLVEPHYTVYGIPYLLSGKTISMVIQHLAPVVFHSVAGFCLGYFFPFLEGKSGWEKGAWLGTAIGLAHIPMIVFTLQNEGWATVAGIFFKHVIVLMLTGFIAFDLVTIRKIYGRKHSWKEVVDVMGWKNALALGSLILTALGSGITSYISGDVQVVLKSLLGGN